MNYLFIVGCPHSGTSIVHRVLSEHPSAHCITGESFLFERQIGEARTRSTLQAWAAEAWSNSKSLILEKTPWHALYIPEILKFCPRAKVLFVFRDPRDVAASLIARGDTQRIKSTPGEISRLWCRIFEIYKSYRASDVVRALKLELFLENPEKTLTGIFTWVNLDASADVVSQALTYHLRPMNIYAESMKCPLGAKDGPEHRQLRNFQVNSPLMRNVSRYKRDLSKDQIEVISLSCREGLEHFDYVT